MAFLTELDVINDMLSSMGESPLNILDAGHPLVPAGQRMLKTASWREQAKSWWFNKELTTLSPDVAGHIFLPYDTIRVDPQDTLLHYTQRGQRLYQPYASASVDKYVFTGPVVCWLVRYLPFDELPATAQLLVSCSAQLDFQKAYDADVNKFQEMKLAYRDALISLNAEHTRSQNVNFLNTSSVSQAMNAITPGLGGARLPTNFRG